MLFAELPYLERPRAAAQAGFSAVETWWPPEGLAEGWADEILRCGLSVTALNSYGGVLEAGDRGFLNLPERGTSGILFFKEAVALARKVGARRINVLVGREIPGLPRRAQLANAITVLREWAAIAEDEGLTLLIEAINDLDTPGYLVPTPTSAAELIEEVGSASVRLLYDAYHAARAGRDPVQEVTSLIGLIDHVQYADCPGRGAPGTGQLSLRRLADALAAAGYDGAIGMEFDPRGPTLDALTFLHDA